MRGIVEQREALRVRRIELKAEAAGQLQLVDDLRPQHRGDEAAGREPRAGEKLLGNAGTAEHVAALDQQDLLAGAAKIVGGNEAIMAAADDDRVIGGVAVSLTLCHA